MSCIISIFTPEKSTVSADSAVSSENRTYTGIEKIIPLSNDPPMVISCYGNSDFEDMPLENIISEYIKKTDFEKIDTVTKVKKDFLQYVHKIMPKQTIENFIKKELISFKTDISSLDEEGLKYYSLIKCPTPSNNVFEKYDFEFEDVAPKSLNDAEKLQFDENMNNIFVSILLEKLSGIVIIGINKTTMKNSYTSFEMIFNETEDVLICNEQEEVDINGTKIKVFAQNDVIKSFFNGIDETLLHQITGEIENYSKESLDILLKNIDDKKLLSKEDFEKIKNEVDYIKVNSLIIQDFMNNFNNIKRENMKNILDEIEIMPRHEIINMSKTLIDLTKLKRILTSEQVTVDGEILTYVLSLKNGIEKYYPNNRKIS